MGALESMPEEDIVEQFTSAPTMFENCESAPSASFAHSTKTPSSSPCPRTCLGTHPIALAASSLHTTSTGGLLQVNNLHSLYVTENHDFGMTCSEFSALLASAVPEGKAASHRLVKTFDCEAANMVDVLEMLCGLVISCTANIGEKVNKLFDLFDFDSTKKVTYDELFILLFSSLRSMVRVLGKGIEPEDSDVEKMADEIFLKAEKEPTAHLSKEELVAWVYDEVNFGTKKVRSVQATKDEGTPFLTP